MGGEKFQKLQSDPPLQLSTKEYNCYIELVFGYDDDVEHTVSG